MIGAPALTEVGGSTRWGEKIRHAGASACRYCPLPLFPVYIIPMTTTSTPTAHTTKIITVCNGGAKARRAVCSCGHLGVRFAYLPKDVKVATAKAEREAASAEWAEHITH